MKNSFIKMDDKNEKAIQIREKELKGQDSDFELKELTKLQKALDEI